MPFAVCFTPDGSTLLGNGIDGAVRLWDPASGKERGRLEGPEGSVSYMALSADGRVLAAAGHSGTVRLWDVPARKELRLLSAPDRQIHGVAVSPDGKLVAALVSDLAVRVWDVATGREVGRPTLPDGQGTPVGRIMFSPDGKLLAAATTDRKLALWRVPTWEPAGTLHGHAARVVDVAFSPDSTRLYSGGDDGWVREWDLATLREARRFGDGQGHVSCVAVAPDGRSLVVGTWREGAEPKLRVWDLRTGTEARAWVVGPTGATAAAFSPDGRVVVTAGGSVRLWDAATGRRLDPPDEAERWIYRLAFSPDGSRLATAGDEPTIRVWDTNRWTVAWRAEGSGDVINGLAFAPDGKALAVVESSRSGRPFKSALRLRDAATGEPVREFPGGGNWFHGIAFSPKGDVLVAHCGPELVVWDPASGREQGRFKPTGRIGDRMAVAADEKTLMAVGGERAVTYWNLATGATAQSFGPTKCTYLIFTISADGRFVAWATGGPMPDARAGGIVVWEAATGREHRVPVRPFPLEALALSPDGRLLASAGPDHDIWLWDLTTGKAAGRFTDPNGRLVSLAFSPDGRRLASSGADGAVLIWDCTAPPKEPVRRPPAGDLDPAEWDRLWDELTSRNEFRAFPAVWELGRRPDRAAPFLQKRLDSHPLRAAGGAARLIADLDSDQFAVRERAARSLEGLGRAAEPDLRRALEGKLSAEAAERVRRLLTSAKGKGKDPSPEELRLGWAVEALERMETAESRKVLEHLAAGGWGADEAKAALARLAR
jgi:WD40 repeat protein